MTCITLLSCYTIGSYKKVSRSGCELCSFEAFVSL